MIVVPRASALISALWSGRGVMEATAGLEEVHTNVACAISCSLNSGTIGQLLPCSMRYRVLSSFTQPRFVISSSWREPFSVSSVSHDVPVHSMVSSNIARRKVRRIFSDE